MKIGGFQWVNQPAIGPSNEHSVGPAQNGLDNIVSRANRQLTNALEVDGFKVYLYRRVLGGSPCPCTRQLQVPRDREGTAKRIRNGYTFELASGRDDGYNLNLNTPDPSESDNFSQTDALPNDTLAERNTSLSGYTEEERLLIGNPSAPYSADSTACGICFNTKRTQGYSLFHGERILLCASDDYRFELHGGATYSEDIPQGFILGNGASVIWDVELPTYIHAESVSVFDNRKRAKNTAAWFSDDNTKTWHPLTCDAINERNGKPKRWKIKAAQFHPESRTTFTHVSLILTDGKLPKVQVPNISQDIVMEDFAPPITQSFTFPPTMFNIERESVFYDCKYGYLWKVTGVYQQKTSTGQIFGYQVTARIIQPHEVFWQLKENMLSTMDVAFRGLEEYQGGAIMQENARLQGNMRNRVHTFTPYQERFVSGKVSDTVDSPSDRNCPLSYDQSPTGPDRSISGQSGNQVARTVGNCVLASNNSLIPDHILNKPTPDNHVSIFNNGGGTISSTGQLKEGETSSFLYPHSPTVITPRESP